MRATKSLYDDGKIAIVRGVDYDRPSFSILRFDRIGVNRHFISVSATRPLAVS